MPDSKRPNVLVFFSDQQRADTAGCYGNPMQLTPNLDAMAGRGTLFKHAFTCQPVCGPARGSLQTGKYATMHGVWMNGVPLPEDESATGLAQHFRAAGYRTGYIGKWHLGSTRTRPVPVNERGGYEFWEAADVLEFTSKPYGVTLFDAGNQPVKLPGYRVDALTERAIRFLRRNGEAPFLLMVSFVEPHQQNDMNAFVAPKGYAERYADCYVPPDLAGHEGDWDRWLPDYYGMVARLDECLGRIVTQLEQLGLADNTIVLYSSDHGCHFRTRNSEYKRSCHESSIRIPLVACGPGFRGGRVVEQLVSLVDLAPTLLNAAGLEVPPRMQGKSLLPVAAGESVDWPGEVFVQISEAQVGRAIRTRRYKYCVDAPDKSGTRHPTSHRYVEQYLYDLEVDPFEQENSVGRAEFRKVADALRGTLIRRMLEAGELEPEIEPAPPA